MLRVYQPKDNLLPPIPVPRNPVVGKKPYQELVKKPWTLERNPENDNNDLIRFNLHASKHVL